MKTLLYAVSMLALFSCSGKDKTPTAPADTTIETSQPPAETASAAEFTAGQGASPTGGLTTWTYEKKADKFTGTVYKASISSPTILNFGFPYAGGSTATLTVRKRDGNTTVYMQVSKGQFNRSFQGGKALIQFDDKAAIPYTWSAAENGSANIIFFDEVQPLLNKLKTARKISVTIGFYAQGNRQIEFRTAGFKWNH